MPNKHKISGIGSVEQVGMVGWELLSVLIRSTENNGINTIKIKLTASWGILKSKKRRYGMEVI
jgi:hypothetical protein